jgi:glycolate oxidase iron-sulfur subunit
MQTHFTLAQLADPAAARSEEILRKCVHCGFCTATCPTYLLLGDELDSPRGRIYLIKDMLETGRAADAATVTHIDRCLSCLSCMTTCPSSVHYMHLVDHARAHIEETYKRPLPERLLRRILALVLPNASLFRLALYGAALARPLQGLLPGRLKGLVAMAPRKIPKASPIDKPQVFPAEGERRMRVALLNGCAQKVLAPNLNEATVRLLTRHGVEVVVANGAGCCGALTHHMGQTADSHRAAAKNIAAWCEELDGDGLDHIVINTSGCGTTVKDYGFMFRNDAELSEPARRISEIACDVSELLSEIGVSGNGKMPRLRIAYHSACSLQHGQKVRMEPMALLEAAGFAPMAVPEGHICCGSAGTYNLLQPELAEQLRTRKLANIKSIAPQVIAAGNLGCMIQIGAGTDTPVVHTVELLDWATGGPAPAGLGGLREDGAAGERIVQD